ncbi:ABC transporter ATP-binding protein [Syntrophomonas erecta subsp. sporosyntropha]
MSGFFEFKNVSHQFGNQTILFKESGRLAPGEILAIKGPSGSGKSTLLRILARLIQPREGTVFYHGINWGSISPQEWRTKIHYVPQKPVIFDGNSEDNLRVPFQIKSSLNIDFPYDLAINYLEQLQLSQSVLSQEARTLSGGEASRLCLVRALLIDPEVLLLDEPTAYLDGDNRKAALRLLNTWVAEKSHRGIILVSHQEDDIDEFDKVSILSINKGEEI